MKESVTGPLKNSTKAGISGSNMRRVVIITPEAA
jgi:hypothetical protein